MSAASYRRYYADNHDLVLRLQAARRRAKRLGLRMVQRGSMIRLFDSAGNLVESGGLDYIEAYLGERFAPRQPGPPLSAPPVKWRPLVEMFVTEQNAAKRRPGTTRWRVMCLQHVRSRPPGQRSAHRDAQRPRAVSEPQRVDTTNRAQRAFDLSSVLPAALRPREPPRRSCPHPAGDQDPARGAAAVPRPHRAAGLCVGG